MKKLVFAGLFLVLVAFGVAYNWAHRSPSGSVGAAAGASAPDGAEAATGISWVTMRDNREKAFSILVPQGWKTYGGLFRFSTIDARMIVDMTSPDGLTNLRIGDSTVPPYRVPGPFLRPAAGCGWVRSRQGIRGQVWSGAIRTHVPGIAVDQKRCVAAKVSSRGKRDRSDHRWRGLL